MPNFVSGYGFELTVICLGSNKRLSLNRKLSHSIYTEQDDHGGSYHAGLLVRGQKRTYWGPFDGKDPNHGNHEFTLIFPGKEAGNNDNKAEYNDDASH